MKNVRKYRKIRFVTLNKKKKLFNIGTKLSYKKCFPENLLVFEMNKTKVKMNKPVYLRLSMSEIRKTVLYAFWYDYIKSMYQDNTKLCYIDT